MKAAVDSSVLFDIVKAAPTATAARNALEAALVRGSLVVCCIVIAELGRYFASNERLLAFLAACHIDHDPVGQDAALAAASIMRAYARNKGPRERVAPDFLIGSHALMQADALLTADTGFYRQYFDGLTVVDTRPTTPVAVVVDPFIAQKSSPDS